jgi:hypothetical protein
MRAFNTWRIAVARLRAGLLVIFFIYGFGAVSFAQDSVSPATAAPSADGSLKAPGKKSHKKASSAASTLDPSSDEAEKAARLAEGRKKFFEQSDGFENKNSDMPLSLGGSNGATPTMGFKF